MRKVSLSIAPLTRTLKRIAWLLLPVILSLLAGALLILAAGQNPLFTYVNLFDAGFSCNAGPGRCALVTALQFATPLILSGLSATVALRGGFFSIGQVGQMLFGAAAASWLAGYLSLPPVIHPAVALVGAALLGGLWGLVPALLKHFIGVNEIIATLLLNPIASVLVGLVWLPRVDVSARLSPLIPSTKLSAGIFIALAAALLVYLFLWRTTRGMEIRANANAPRFALYGGMPVHKPVLLAMALSGALAGLAGGVEVLGVHYQFVSNFSAVNDFDGLIIAFAGQPASRRCGALRLPAGWTTHRLHRGIADSLRHPTRIGRCAYRIHADLRCHQPVFSYKWREHQQTFT